MTVSAGILHDAPASLVWEPGGNYNLAQTLSILPRGKADPTVQLGPDGVWLAFNTGSGPASLHLRSRVERSGDGRAQTVAVHADGWGEGADEALIQVPRLLGADDDWSGFDDPDVQSTLPRLVTETRRRHRDLRLPATGRMVDAVVPAVLEQKVTSIEAWRGYTYLLRKHGTPAPGAHEGGPVPAELKVAPTAAQWRRIPSWDWHRAGVGPQRSATVMRAVQLAAGLERLAELGHGDELTRKLCTVPGIGPWTAAEVTQRTHGDPDSISVGDYHLASYVGWALIGRPVDDDGMLELLEPWRGHRQRVVRMIGLSGFRKPTFGPRMTIQDHRFH